MADTLELTLWSIGTDEPIKVEVLRLARVADVLMAAGHDKFSAKLLHGETVLSPGDDLDKAGIHDSAELTIIMVPPESVTMLCITGASEEMFEDLEKDLPAASLPPIDIAYCFGQVLCFYGSVEEAEAVKLSEEVRSIVAKENERRAEKRRTYEEEHPGRNLCFAYMSVDVQPCRDPCCGVADYHLEGLRRATGDGALAPLGAPSEVQLSICAALESFLDAAEQEENTYKDKDWERREMEQCQAAELQLRILDARKLDEAVNPEVEKAVAQLRTIFNLIARGLLLLHCDRFADMLAALGRVTKIEELQIETE